MRALGRGSADLLRSVWPEAEMEFMDFGNRPRALPWGRARSLVRERMTGRAGMMPWLRGFDVLWDTRSGDSFTDIYGLSRHAKMAAVHEFAVQAGVRAVLAPQTIGPFGTRRGRLLARRNLRRSSLVFARDHLSAAAAAELGRPVDRTATDLVFGIAQPRVMESPDVAFNVSGLLWQPNGHVDHIAYQRAVRGIIDSLLSLGREVTILPHVLDSHDGDNDVPASSALFSEYDGRVGMYVPTGLDDARSVVKGSRLVIGARMHACLNALSTGTPAIAMAYSRKFKPLLDDLEWPHVVSVMAGGDVVPEVITRVQYETLTADALRVMLRAQARLGDMRPLLRSLT